MQAGSLVCVGVGMTLGSHLTPLARSHLEQADVVFAAVSDGIVERWLCEMNSNVRSLQSLYREGVSRLETYRGMVRVMLDEVRAGKRVCGAFYGHPGVFAWPPHEAIRQAKREGFHAHMEPGVSAEDCLYADLGIDPATYGCQHYEATQFMLFERRIDLSAYLILWQIGVAGDKSASKFITSSAHRQLLVEALLRHYPRDHVVTIYRAPTLPLERPLITNIPLDSLADAAFDMHATLAVPPCKPLEPNLDMRERLAELEHTLRNQTSRQTHMNWA